MSSKCTLAIAIKRLNLIYLYRLASVFSTIVDDCFVVFCSVIAYVDSFLNFPEKKYR